MPYPTSSRVVNYFIVLTSENIKQHAQPEAGMDSEAFVFWCSESARLGRLPLGAAWTQSLVFLKTVTPQPPPPPPHCVRTPPGSAPHVSGFKASRGLCCSRAGRQCGGCVLGTEVLC